MTGEISALIGTLLYVSGSHESHSELTVEMYISFFFFLAFADYTIKATREMNDVVFSSSCLQP